MYKKIRAVALLALWSILVAFDVSGADLESYTFRLAQSTGQYVLWTAPPSHRVFQKEAVPGTTGAMVKVYAAANEFEPFQIVVRPTTSSVVNVSIDDFGAGIHVDMYQVQYVSINKASDNLGQTGPYPDPLWPLGNGATVQIAAGVNTAFWFSVAVPESTPPGDYTSQVRIGGVVIPVALHVFDFSLPPEVHVKSQMNFSHQTLLSAYGVSGTGSAYWWYVDRIKQYFIDHRLTPKSVLWSGGLTGSRAAPYIDYNCSSGTFTDPHSIWGFEDPARRYLDGTGQMRGTFNEQFNDGTGFPSFMAATFGNNDASADQRPSSFCNRSRTTDDWYRADNPSSPYNQAWFTYIGAMQRYLTSLGYREKAYYYFANEPQDKADYDAVAWYSRYLKQAAPSLKLMISENPRPEIYNHPDYVQSGQIDIWLPVLNQYDPGISHARERDHGEESWVYFLHGTRPPFFNPITLDHPGIESKLTGWFLWKYRIRGLAYYSFNNWTKNPWVTPLNDGHNGDLFMLYPPSRNNTPIAYGDNAHRFVPSIRFELMRDSLEDYEYLYLLNGSARPEVDQANPADTQVSKIISGLTSYNRDDQFIYNLRRLIGLKLSGEIVTIPDIRPGALHPRSQGSPGNYYINFQDPEGEPTATPLSVNGRSYLKIGWNPYNQSLGYGWYGDLDHVMYRYLNSGPGPLKQSVIFDDWGRKKTFEFDLPNGTYEVTVSVGWQGRTYTNNFIQIEGVTFINGEASSPYLVRHKTVHITDNKLTMAMGIFDEYTMLNYLVIEANGGKTALPGTLLLLKKD